MKLTFPRDRVLKLISHTKASADHKTLYGTTTGLGLWLVGDEGIYLMSNASNKLPSDIPGRDEFHYVAYANESNPQTMSFDDYRTNKEEAFGGDDGTEFLKLNEVETCLGSQGDLVIGLTPGRILLMKNETPGRRNGLKGINQRPPSPARKIIWDKPPRSNE